MPAGAPARRDARRCPAAAQALNRHLPSSQHKNTQMILVWTCAASRSGQEQWQAGVVVHGAMHGCLHGSTNTYARGFACAFACTLSTLSPCAFPTRSHTCSMWGRFLGLAFALPAAYFAARRWINGPLARRLGLLFFMGGTQVRACGARPLGWGAGPAVHARRGGCCLCCTREYVCV